MHLSTPPVVVVDVVVGSEGMRVDFVVPAAGEEDVGLWVPGEAPNEVIVTLVAVSEMAGMTAIVSEKYGRISTLSGQM